MNGIDEDGSLAAVPCPRCQRQPAWPSALTKFFGLECYLCDGAGVTAYEVARSWQQQASGSHRIS